MYSIKESGVSVFLDKYMSALWIRPVQTSFQIAVERLVFVTCLFLFSLYGGYSTTLYKQQI
jgi:hypothetical protein